MSWRTVVISKRAKLDLKNNFMVVRRNEGFQKIYLGEMSVLIIESTAVSLTTSLLVELMKRKVKVIFCDEKRNPSAELIGYYGSHDTTEKIRRQINWTDETKALVWTEIVREKIRQQREVLLRHGLSEAQLLEKYLDAVELNDVTNREGHAARVYFRALFGSDFSRGSDDCVNAALNYGYSILLSAFNRDIVANGYITQLGIGHSNMFNPFNLSSDLMEPFRPLVDNKVVQMGHTSFGSDEKMELVNLLNVNTELDGKVYVLNNALSIYVKSVLDALSENDLSLIKRCRYEL